MCCSLHTNCRCIYRYPCIKWGQSTSKQVKLQSIVEALMFSEETEGRRGSLLLCKCSSGEREGKKRKKRVKEGVSLLFMVLWYDGLSVQTCRRCPRAWMHGCTLVQSQPHSYLSEGLDKPRKSVDVLVMTFSDLHRKLADRLLTAMSWKKKTAR